MVSPSSRSGRGRWYYGWNIVAATVVAQIAGIGMGVNGLSLFLGHWSADLHSPISELLLAVIPLVVVSGLIAPLIGSLADKYPTRWLFGAGLLGVAAFSLAMSFVTATWQIWALYVVFPVASNLCGAIPSSAVVSRWFVRHGGVALGIVAFGNGISGILVSPLIAKALPLIGWRAVWGVAAAVIAVLVLPLIVFVLRDRPTEREGLHYLSGDRSVPVSSHAHGAGGPSSLAWSEILKRRNFWFLALYFPPIISLYLGVLQNLAPIAASRALEQSMAGMLLALFSVAHGVSTLSMGFLSDRFGNRLPLAGIALLTAIGALVIAYGKGTTAMIVATVLCGFGGGVWTLLPAAAAVEFGSGGVGRVMGALFLFLPLSSVVPALIARTNESFGSYGPAMLVLGGACVGAAFLVLMIRERRGHVASVSAYS